MSNRVNLGVYEHFSGNHYNVIGFGHQVVGNGTEENVLEEVVIYQAMFTSPTYGDNYIWVRPIANFTENIEVSGKLIPRFRYIGPQSVPDSGK